MAGASGAQDVQRIFGSTRAHGQQPFATDERISAATEIVLAHCLAILEQNGLSELQARASSELEATIESALAARIRGVGNAHTVAQMPYEERLALTRFITSERAGHVFLSRWLGAPSPPARSPASHGDDAGGLVRPSLAEQIQQSSIDRPLALTSDTSLLADEGGPGAGNGVLDAGEWVHLHIALQNQGDRPLFSSSAWLAAPGECTWVDDEREYELQEMDSRTGSAFLEPWVFLASDCDQPGPRPLAIKVYDSHQLSEAPQTIAVALRVRSPGRAELAAPVIDADTPGSSDGDRATAVVPGGHFEVSAGVRVSTPDATSARQRIGVSKLARGLFTTFSFRQRAMHRAGAGTFDPGDDIDALVLDGSAYRDAMTRLSRASRWYSDTGGGAVWLAVETVVTRPFELRSPAHGELATAAEATPAPAVLGTENADVGDHRADKATSRRERRRLRRERRRREKAAREARMSAAGDGADAQGKCGRSPSDAEISGLVAKHVTLAARPASPVTQDSVAAAEGYEVVFDRARFLDAYHKLLGDCAGPRVVEAPPALTFAHVQYQYVNYMKIDLPAIRTAAPARRRVEEPEELPQDIEPVVEVARAAAPRAGKVDIDVGLGWGSYSLASPPGWIAWPDGVTTTAMGIRASYGRRLTGIVDLGHASFTVNDVFFDNRSGISVDFSELSINAGLGYRLPIGSIVELHPRLMLGAQHRNYNASTATWNQWQSSTAFGVTPGLSVRALLARNVGWFRGLGAFLDISRSIVGDGPPAQADGPTIANGNVQRIVLGLAAEL